MLNSSWPWISLKVLVTSFIDSSKVNVATVPWAFSLPHIRTTPEMRSVGLNGYRPKIMQIATRYTVHFIYNMISKILGLARFFFPFF